MRKEEKGEEEKGEKEEDEKDEKKEGKEEGIITRMLLAANR